MRRFWAVLLVFTCLVAVSCSSSSDDGGESADAESAAGEEEESDDEESSDAEEQIEIDDPEDVEEEELDEEEIVERVSDFWDDQAEDVGLDFQEVDEDRTFSIGDDDVPPCNGGPFPVEQFVANAAVTPSCGEGMSVVWDPDYLDERREVAGEAGPVVTFAHEFGHVIQYQNGILDTTGFGEDLLTPVLAENQADCFAGAFIEEQVEEEWGPFVDPGAIDRALVARLSSADPVGFDPNDPQAHGSGFDRVRAFQDGVNQGVEYCYGYVDDPPFIDESLFSTEEDFANQGNLPFDDVVDLVLDDLEWYFEENVDDFEEPDDPFELFDEDDLEDFHGDIGDGVVPTVLGLTWAQAAQESVGEDTDGEGPLLQRACVVGAWIGDILRDQRDGFADRPSGAQMSPGDLDEAIETLLLVADETMQEGGIAFEAIFDMRQGVFGNLEDCRLDD